MRLLVLFALLGALIGCQPRPQGLSPEDIARNNEAVGLMGQYRNEDARAIFATLAERYPDQPQLRSNEAIATLNRQTEGDEERALALATAVLRDHPEHLPAQYVSGLAHLYLGRVEQALPHLLTVAENDPLDAHAAYFAGQALGQSGRSDEALAFYRRAIEADPYLGSAYYAAALVLRGRGEADEARRLLSEYQRLQGNPRAKLAEFRYTRMGDKATAQVMGATPDEAAEPPTGPLFAAAAPLGVQTPPGNGHLLTADLDQDGLQDLVSVGEGGLHVWRRNADGYAEGETPAGAQPGLWSAAFGDLDNDGVLDAALCGDAGVSLWTLGGGIWSPRDDQLPDTALAPCADLQLFDADHDGDLDLYRLGGEGQPAELFNNNLDGTWRALSESSPGLGGPESGSRQLLVLDVDADRDLDLVFLGHDGGIQWQRNDRLWRYVIETLEPIWLSGWVAATAIDVAADGTPDLVLLDTSGRAWLGQLTTGNLDPLPLAEALRPAVAVQALEVDGDGHPDLLFRHVDGLTVLRRDRATWQVAWQYTGALDTVLALMEDPAQGYSLVLSAQQADATDLLRFAPGPGRHHFLAVAPTGRSTDSEGMRSNASGLGTQVRVRRGTHWTLADQLDRNSAPGQSLQPLVIGLGPATGADFVELQWSDGVMQTELALQQGPLHTISETQRQLASCPVLFVWDGERFRFVSDLLGVGGVGFLLSPDHYAEPRPWEYFRLPEGLAQTKDGVYRIKIAEPMEEAAYLDSLRLHVYDLPAGWAMALDERMHTGGGPAPTGKPIFYRRDAAPAVRSLQDQEGRDLRDALMNADFVAVDPGPRDPRFLGRLQSPQHIEIHLAEPLLSGQDYALIGQGWVEYPYSQTLFAAWQAGADYASFSLDVADQAGPWQEVFSQFGYPAGMPREFALPLPGELPPTTSLRLRGNLEVYLDQLQVVKHEAPPAGLRHRVLTPRDARLERVGYPRRETHAGKRPDYDFAARSPFWDTRYPEGLYTDFGPVDPLLENVDDGFVIVGPGDALDVAFEPPEPVAPGYTRVLVLEARGYAKDMDLYTRDGGTLTPLPITPDLDPDVRAAGERLNATFNQRFQGGR